jgi:hypothetical protein
MLSLKKENTKNYIQLTKQEYNTSFSYIWMQELMDYSVLSLTILWWGIPIYLA